jgi:hypothetical protein
MNGGSELASAAGPRSAARTVLGFQAAQENVAWKSAAGRPSGGTGNV